MTFSSWMSGAIGEVDQMITVRLPDANGEVYQMLMVPDDNGEVYQMIMMRCIR